MRNDALPALISVAVISGVLCLLIGGAVGWLMLAPASAPATGPAAPVATSATTQASSPDPVDSPPAQPEAARLRDELQAAKQLAEKLQADLSAAEQERDGLAAEGARLSGRVKELETKLAEAQPQPVPTPTPEAGSVEIRFGSWGDLPELKNADWKELGGALQAMTPQMEPLARAIREGRQPDAEAMKKIGAQNMKLVKLAVALQGKVPTHVDSVNGEYTHPVSIANLLAAQLAAAGNPLSDAQKKRLSELGEDYEKRWKVINDAYTPETMQLRKIMDEAELKQWFTEQMWLVTTPEQKALVVSPQTEGYLGIDLYSPALMFQGVARPLQANSRDTLKGHMKDWIAQQFGVARDALDGAEYAFDDWLTTLNPEPKSASEASFVHISELLKFGRAQLALLTNLLTTVLSDPEVAKNVRGSSVLIMPQVLQP